MTQQKSVMSGIGTMAVLTISSKLVRLVILMITARFLTPEDFGIVAAFTMAYGFAYIFANMGVVRTIIQRPAITDRHIGSALTLSMLLSLLVAIILFFLSDTIANIFTIGEISLPLKVSSAVFLLLGVSNISSALLQRNGEVVFIGKVQAFGTIFGNIFVTVPLLYFDIGFWSIIIGLWVSELISVLFILQKGIKNLAYKSYKQESIEVIRYALAFFLNNTLGLLSQQLDIAIVSRYMGSAALGNYSRTMQLVEFPNQLYWLVVDRVVFPVMSAMKTKKDELALFFLQSLSLLSLVLTIGTIILILGSKEIVYFMMGEQWEAVSDLLKILAACIIFRALSSFMDSFLAAYDLVKILTIKQIFSLLILLICLWGAIRWGLEGIAYAVVVASLLRFLVTLLVIIIYTNVIFLHLCKSFLPSFFTFLTIFTMYNINFLLLSFDGLWSILLCVSIYFIFCVLSPISLFVSDIGKKTIIKKRSEYVR